MARASDHVDSIDDGGAADLALANRPDSVRNSRLVPSESNGKPTTREVPLTIPEIIERISRATDRWPRRIGSALFVHEAGRPAVSWLESPSALFGWLNTQTGPVHWRNNTRDGTGFATQEEVFCELRRKATNYEAIEVYPHEPRLDRHYYLCENIAPGDGATLRKFVRLFSPATDADGDLILAMILSLFFGGPPGSIPCFAITSDDGRGAGKTTLANVVAALVGGTIDVSANETIRDLKERLLSPDATTKRVVLIDNLKSLKFSYGELEALITASQISGRRMYVGEAARPNNLVWMLTLNGANFSEDMAQRSVIVKLAKRTYNARFHDRVSRFLLKHQPEIVADAVGILRAKPATLSGYSRWSLWERGVLAHVADPAECQRVIAERQAQTNVDVDEVEIVEEHVAEQLASCGYQPDVDVVRIPADVMAKWYASATNERDARTARVGRLICQWIDEKKTRSLFRDSSRRYGRGWIWRGTMADPTCNARNDLENRLEDRENGRKGYRK